MVRGLWCKKLIFYGNVVFFFVFEAKNVKMMKFGKNIPLWLGEWGCAATLFTTSPLIRRGGLLKKGN
jgi:hypothetical protein